MRCGHPNEIINNNLNVEFFPNMNIIKKKVAYITNILPPYRINIYKLLSENIDYKFKFIFCTKSESNRNWNIDASNIDATFLSKKNTITIDGFNYIHFNLNIIRTLAVFKPQIIIITGFTPTMLLSILYAKVFNIPIIYHTDGNIDSEKGQKKIHVLLRKYLFKLFSAFIGTGLKSKMLFNKFGIADKKIFISPLSVNNLLFSNTNNFHQRNIDLIFCGQLHDRKMPFFFLEVLNELKKRHHEIKSIIAGDGPLRESIISEINRLKINCNYLGSLKYEELPHYYGISKICFFSTRLDAWGLVANEAMASGTPVITTPFAGAAGELVLNEFNGFICAPEVNQWSNLILTLLNDIELWNKMSKNSLLSVNNFDTTHSMNGIINALGSL